MAELRFDGRVVVVTGAGAGLGRAYALLFASRGASVVVNDLGGGRHGDGKSSSAADAVVQEIKSKGGKAVADYNNVVEGEKIIETALANFGRVDVLINNAGILRDKSFPRISVQDWDIIQDVHLKGAFKCTQAAWPHMQKQNYGRVIMTSSNSGMYGNFGQANYSAAKMGLVGLANTLAIEGRKKNINVNVILPTAASRLTEDILPPDFFAELKPELIAPVVGWLCHEKCQDTGSYIEAAAGWAAKAHLVRNEGAPLRVKISHGVTPEDVMRKWDAVTDMSEARHYESITEASGGLYGVIEKMKENETAPTSNQAYSESTFEVTNKAAILFALGVGTDLREPSNLKYLFEMHDEFSALPCFAYIPSTVAVIGSSIMQNALPNGVELDLTKFLHGEEYVELYKPIPTSGILKSRVTIADVLDKGKGAVILCDVDTFDESGEKVAYTQMTGFVVGAGGFGGKRDSPRAVPTVERPRRSPDFSVKEKVHHNQAALYRLSGDPNPLHVDPNFAQLSGFDKPILHGLCSLGISTKLVLFVYGDNNPAYCKAFKARFAKPVFPGQTLKVDMWREGSRVHFETSVVESGNVVISGAYMDLSKVCQPVAPNFVAAALASDPIFQAIKDGIEANKQKAAAVNGVFQWNITKGGKQETQWVMDLKKGTLYPGEPEKGTKVDTFLTIDDQDMVDMSTGKLNPQTAFMKGKLKIKGNIMLTQKLKNVLPSDSKL